MSLWEVFTPHYPESRILSGKDAGRRLADKPHRLIDVLSDRYDGVSADEFSEHVSVT